MFDGIVVAWDWVVNHWVQVSAFVALIWKIQHDRLEKQKLRLEIVRLRNSPEIIAERRALYDQMRCTFNRTCQEGALNDEQVSLLNAVIHDSELCFPADVCNELKALRPSLISLNVYGQSMEEMRSMPNLSRDPRWLDAVKEIRNAKSQIWAFQGRMLELFRPHLTP